MTELSPLYALASNGKCKLWKIAARDNGDGTASIITTHGYVDGKQQTTEKVVSKGKNIGKANETTPFEQAIRDAGSKWRKKYDSGYREDAEAAAESEAAQLPMKAHKYTERRHNLVWPLHAQPKLDGMRMLGGERPGTPLCTSKLGKEVVSVPHLHGAITAMSRILGAPLDGELYQHKETFQSIMRKAKKLRPESSELEYWVYDVADPSAPFRERIRSLVRARQQAIREGVDCSQVKILKGGTVDSEDQVRQLHDLFARAGFEGIMLRNLEGKYVFNHRSADLQKWKYFEDREFTIIGGKPATGTMEGCVVFTCALETGETFDVSPRGTREQKRLWMDTLEDHLGKRLTVRFQGYSEDGAPIFPVGIAIRDYE